MRPPETHATKDVSPLWTSSMEELSYHLQRQTSSQDPAASTVTSTCPCAHGSSSLTDTTPLLEAREVSLTVLKGWTWKGGGGGGKVLVDVVTR